MIKTHAKTLAATALAALMLAAQPALAGAKEAKPAAKPAPAKTVQADKAQKAQDSATIRKKAGARARKTGAGKADIEREKILAEAVAAVRETENAIKALDKKDKKAALDALARATGKLEIILAAEPNLALAPVNVQSQVLDIYADIKAVRAAVDKAVTLLKKGRVQDARALVSGLASEIVIEVVNVPLATYPDAIKAVVPLIQKGKFKEAREALVTALNTLIITRHIIPLPVLRTEEMLARAEKLAEKAKRTPAEEKELAGILKAARTELQFAEALGYGKEGDFKPFYAQLDKIAAKTKGGKHGKGFFDELKKALAHFRAKIF